MPAVRLEVSAAVALLSFALVLASLAVLLHGLLQAADDLTTPRLLLLGFAAAALSVPAALAARPEALSSSPGLPTLGALFAADLLRVAAAVSVGVSLSRHVSSSGVAILIAGVATAADLFSVFAGPTKAIVESGSSALDFLLLVFPVLGTAYGFGLGVSDFIFVALFAAIARYLALRPTLTLAATVAAALLALAASILLQRPLPALPFVSLAFVLVNGDLLLASLRKHPRA
jgi:hypothetical protein